MHLPDGFLDAKTAVASGVLAAVGLGCALRSVRQSLPPRRIPLLGMASAFVFAAQMINFPVAAGTSGHLIGAVLTAVLLGPGAAAVVMTSVLILQCLLFQDGGLTALGANIFNLGIVAPGIGYALYSVIRRAVGPSLRWRAFAAAFATWMATIAAAIVCAGELASSGTVSWRAAFPAMAGIHAVIGLVEALVTSLIVISLARLRPELLAPSHESATLRAPRKLLIIEGLLITAGLAIFVAPFACGWPDGLEQVAISLGFSERASADGVLLAPWPDYQIPGIESRLLSAAVVGGVGTLAAFGLCWTMARSLTRSALRPGRPSEGAESV